MTTDEIAEKLGYYDTKHLEDNIANYGEPLDTWWAVIKNLVNNYDIIPHVSNCVKCGEREGKGKTKQCDTCLMDGIV